MGNLMPIHKNLPLKIPLYIMEWFHEGTSWYMYSDIPQYSDID